MSVNNPAIFSFSTKDEQLAAVRHMNMFSNVFMSVALEDADTCTYVLRILTRISDLEVIEVKTQSHISKLISRDVILDVLAKDSNGRLYNIEIQRADTIDHVRRVRLYRSEVDSELLQKGTPVDALPNLYILYLSETDIFHQNLAWDEVVQHFHRAGIPYDDGCHIFYANAEVDEQDDISKLMLYFKTADPNDSNYGALSQRVHFLKCEKEGEAIMCQITDGFIQEGMRRGFLQSILNLMDSTHWDVNQAMEALHIAPEERATYAAFVKAAQSTAA